LRCIIDAASDVIFIKGRDSVYLGCNKASEEFIGLPESEQIGKTDFDFFDQEMASTIQEKDRQVLEKGETLRTEEWVTYPDGHSVLLDTLKAPFYGSDGEIRGLVGISRNITERKRSEEMLHLQTVELEQEVAERQMAQESLQEKALLLEKEIEKRQKAQDELENLNDRLEQRVKQRTAELEAKNAELQKMNRLFVNRELKMVELKERIKELEGHQEKP
jgi:PAS domain S-box-containing protein